MWIVEDNYESGYKHRVLSCCPTCRNIQVYKVTDDILEANTWSNTKCKECGVRCDICILSKYQKPPGFARKCKKCDFRFTCATIRIKEMSTISLYTLKVEFGVDEE